MKITRKNIIDANNRFMNMSKEERDNIPNHIKLTQEDINNAYNRVLLKNNMIKKDYNKIDSKFKKDDIVVCISVNGIIGRVDIEVGKKYKITNVNTIRDLDSSKYTSFLQLENVYTVYLDKYFQSLEENRIEKINKLKNKINGNSIKNRLFKFFRKNRN